MDERGNLYDLMGEGVANKEHKHREPIKLRNIETNTFKNFPQHSVNKLLMVPKKDRERVIAMSRKDRKKYYKDNKVK